MSTPTLSMQIHGEMGRAKALARSRSEAAKKAWRTRRRLAKPSPRMLVVLAYLAKHAEARLALGYITYNRRPCYCYSSLNGPYDPSLPRHLSYTTFRALEKRGWLVFDKRKETGGSHRWEGGMKGEFEPSYDLLYMISDKGRKVLAAV